MRPVPAAISLLLLSLIFFFQNCGIKSATEGDLSNYSAKSNGGGYDGKLSYLHLNAKGCDDGTQVDSEIQVVDGKFLKTRDNCKEVEATEVSDREFIVDGHNRSFGLSGKRLFQASGSYYQGSEIFCKGEKQYLSGGTDKVDLWIDPAGDGKFTGKILVGRYSNGLLKEVIESEGFNVNKVTRMPALFGEIHYLAQQISESRSYLLMVKLADLTARFASAQKSFGPPPVAPTQQPPPLLPALPPLQQMGPPALNPADPANLSKFQPLQPPGGIVPSTKSAKELAEMITIDQMFCGSHTGIY